MKRNILLLYKNTIKWWNLNSESKLILFNTTISPIIKKYESELNIKFFDAQSVNQNNSNFITIDCEDLNTYYQFIGELNESKFFTEKYAQLNDTIIGVKNEFQSLEYQTKQAESRQQYFKYLSLIF